MKNVYSNIQMLAEIEGIVMERSFYFLKSGINTPPFFELRF